jgi:hypothetical protein
MSLHVLLAPRYQFITRSPRLECRLEDFHPKGPLYAAAYIIQMA